MTAEREKMTKCYHLNHFTGGISIQQRNEGIRSYIRPALKNDKDFALADAVKRILQVSEMELFKLTHEYQTVSSKHDEVFKN